MMCRIKDTVLPVCPVTASIKHHVEVYSYGLIHTNSYRHNYINENDQIKEKSMDKKASQNNKNYILNSK